MAISESSERRVYVFDLGGVCCTFEHDRRMLALCGVSGLPEAEVMRRLWDSGFVEDCNRGRFTAREAFFWARGALGLRISYPAFSELWSSAFTPEPAVLRLVDSLRASHRTAMLTDNGPVLRDGMPSMFPEVYGRFDQVLFSCDLGAVKPETKLFMAATRRLRVAPQRITLIDDVPEFVAAARAFGWQAFVYTESDELATMLKADASPS